MQECQLAKHASAPSSPGHPYVFNEETGLLSPTGIPNCLYRARGACLELQTLSVLALVEQAELDGSVSAGKGTGEAGARERKQYIEDNRTGAGACFDLS